MRNLLLDRVGEEQPYEFDLNGLTGGALP